MNTEQRLILDHLPHALTTTEVAAYLRVTERDVTTWLEAGHITGYRLPDRWIIRRDDLAGYLDTTRNTTPTQPPLLRQA